MLVSRHSSEQGNCSIIIFVPSLSSHTQILEIFLKIGTSIAWFQDGLHQRSAVIKF